MRSPDSRRGVAELVARGNAALAMVALAARLWSGTSPAGPSTVVPGESLDSALASWTTSPGTHVTLSLSPLPDARQRDWLVALRRTGLGIDWRTRDSTHLALVAEAGALPQLPMRLVALGSPASLLRVADDLGVFDSTNTGDDGVATWRASPVGSARATIGRARAIAEPRDSLVTRPVLVIGQAGWETKFVTAALEETGWKVASRMTVAPDAVVRQGDNTTIDTASLSAVVVLDSTSELQSSTISRFVGEGGGLIAGGAGVNHPALRSILPRVTAAIPAEIGALQGPTPREGLLARRLRADAGVILEQRAAEPTVVGRRVGAGRAVAMGYDDTWRLRLAPPDESAPEAHRAWWSSLVASVVRVRLVPREAVYIDEAPLAATINALGPPLAGDTQSPGRTVPWSAILAAIAVLALLGEWLSRRLRGVS